MTNTSIVRRIDDLGRVVIPKELRRALKVREGDPLELWVDKGTLCARKYSHLVNIADDAQIQADVLCDNLVVNGPRFSVLITDKHTVIAKSGALVRTISTASLIGDDIAAFLDKSATIHATLITTKGDIVRICDAPIHVSQVFMHRITVSGDTVGAVVLFHNENDLSPVSIGETEKALVAFVAAYLSKLASGTGI